LTITGTEAVSGGGEQVAVNNAIIETLKDNGVDVSQIDTSLLDGIREAMILEAVWDLYSWSVACCCKFNR
jgi:hypothetical protein